MDHGKKYAGIKYIPDLDLQLLSETAFPMTKS
jgi:hypothetical protein